MTESLEPLLRIQGLHKSYAVPVLKNVHLDLQAGEVHGVVGENGAGKSTLVRIIAGLTHSDQGQMKFQGSPYAPRARREAERAGVRLVMQELNLIPTLSVAENIHFAALPRRFGFIDYPRLHAQAARDLAAVGLDHLDPATPVSRLGVGQQQLVEIAAAITCQGKILILDEPTAALTDPEIERLFNHIRRLKQVGVGILYISHRLEEIQKITDRVTVLRDGRVMGTHPTTVLSLAEIIRLMAGRTLTEQKAGAPRLLGGVALRVDNLTCHTGVRQVQFTVRHGEILGLAGLIGSGRTETLRAIFGADRPETGRVYLGGATKPLRIRSPIDAVRAGIGMIPEDRKQQGLLLTQSVRMNMSFPNLERMSHARIWIDGSRETAAANELARQLDVRSASVEQPVAELSGGNQQKVVMARWLMRRSQVLLFDEPTRGIDVGTKWMIYQLLLDLARAGKTMVVASSDLLELMSLCDRIAVMSAGRLVQMFERDRWSEEAIMAAAFSGYLGGKHRI